MYGRKNLKQALDDLTLAMGGGNWEKPSFIQLKQGADDRAIWLWQEVKSPSSNFLALKRAIYNESEKRR